MSNLLALPAFGAIRGASGFLQDLDWSLDLDGQPKTLRFYPRWSWLQPWLLAAVAAWGLRAQEVGKEIVVENGDAAAYPWRFGLADYLGVQPTVSVTPHEESGRFVALRTINGAEEHARLMADVVTLLHLSEEPEQAKAVQYVLSELVRNVREHSASTHGAVVAAQYYRGEKGQHYVSVGVADTGVGLRQTLLRNHPVPNERTAVELAIRPGITGARVGEYGSSDNAGAGLFFTRRLAESSKAYFAIASGSAMFRSSLAKRRVTDDKLVLDISPYPGTFVCVNFGVEEGIDFDEFLQTTGQAFTQLDQRLRDKVRQRVRFG